MLWRFSGYREVGRIVELQRNVPVLWVDCVRAYVAYGNSNESRIRPRTMAMEKCWSEVAETSRGPAELS